MRKTLVLNCLMSEMRKYTVKPGQVCTAVGMHRTADIAVRTQVTEIKYSSSNELRYQIIWKFLSRQCGVCLIRRMVLESFSKWKLQGHLSKCLYVYRYAQDNCHIITKTMELSQNHNFDCKMDPKLRLFWLRETIYFEN